MLGKWPRSLSVVTPLRYEYKSTHVADISQKYKYAIMENIMNGTLVAPTPDTNKSAKIKILPEKPMSNKCSGFA